MQALWSRSARSNCTCRCLLCLNAARTALSRRATTAAGHRQVKFKDAIFVTYMTIFAGGIIADKKRKDGRRDEWERKIAEVKEEAEKIRNRCDDRALEGRPLASAVQRSISMKDRVPGNRRHYSTAQSAPLLDDSGDMDPLQITNEMTRKAPAFPNANDTEVKPSYQRGNAGEGGRGIVDEWIVSGQEPPLRMRAIRALSVKRLALKILLRPAIQRSYGQPEMFHVGGYIPKAYIEGAFDQTTSQNIQGLLRELAETRKNITHSRTGQLDDAKLEEMFGSTFSGQEELYRSERLKLDDELRAMFSDFHLGRMDLKDLLFKVATNLLQSAATPLTSTFELLVCGFTKAMQNDLVYTVLNCFRESRRGLSTGIINATFEFYIRSKDLYSFDKYLTFLTGKEKTADYFEPWKTITIGNREVAVPPPQHAKILRTLLYGALKFDQPHRAEMWHAALRRYGEAENPSTLQTYVRHYALTRNWALGKEVLEKACRQLQARTSSESGNETKSLEHLTFWMLHLCLSCSQIQLYRRIINYAVERDFKYTIVGRYKQSWQAAAIMQDWRDARLAHPEKPVQQQTENARRIETVKSELFDGLLLADETSDNVDFFPRYKSSVNLEDEKAAYAARTATYRSYHTSSLTLSPLPKGTVLKPEAIGYKPEDLDSDLSALPSQGEFEENLKPSVHFTPIFHGTHKPTEPRATVHEDLNSPKNIHPPPNPKSPPPNPQQRHNTFLLKRLAITDTLEDLNGSIASLKAEIESIPIPPTKPRAAHPKIIRSCTTPASISLYPYSNLATDFPTSAPPSSSPPRGVTSFVCPVHHTFSTTPAPTDLKTEPEIKFETSTSAPTPFPTINIRKVRVSTDSNESVLDAPRATQSENEENEHRRKGESGFKIRMYARKDPPVEVRRVVSFGRD
jgi:hypothetical protein